MNNAMFLRSNSRCLRTLAVMVLSGCLIVACSSGDKSPVEKAQAESAERGKQAADKIKQDLDKARGVEQTMQQGKDKLDQAVNEAAPVDTPDPDKGNPE